MPVFYVDHQHHQKSFALFRHQKPQTGCTAAHCLAETYSVITGRVGKYRASPDEALLFLSQIREHLSIVTLDEQEYLSVLANAASSRVHGGTIHDAVIAGCAKKAKAKTIYTWNLKHFAILEHEVSRLQSPP